MFPFRRENSSASEELHENQDAPKAWSSISTWRFVSLVDITGSLWDLLTDWLATRQWSRVMALAPVILIGLVLGTAIAIGRFGDENKRLADYVDRADQEIKNSSALSSEEEGKEPDNEKPNNEKERSELIDLLFRRVLQINQSNKRAIFHVAAQLARYGKRVVAKQMMEGLAPAQHSGYELAHAWLAEDLVRMDQSGQKINVDLLKHHLKNAVSRQDVDPKLLVVYTKLLQRDEQISEAEQLLPRVVKYDPGVLLGAIALYNRNGLTGQAKATSEVLVDSIKDKMTGDKSDPYVVLAARAFVMTGRIDEGLLLLQNAFKQRPRSLLLRRAISDAFLVKFRATAVRTESQIRVSFDLLNAAIAYDPTNLSVKEVLASISIAGRDNGIMDSLRAQIAASGTSYAARLMMAESYLRRKEIEAAVKEYEVVLAELPNMTLVLNDLSMLYTMLEKPRLTEALELIDRAVSISPEVSEFHDSRAQVLVACGRKTEAANEYLLALESSPLRLKTREKLIEILEEMGQTDEADTHRKKLEEAKQWVRDRQEKADAVKPSSNTLDSPSPPMVD